MKEAKKFVLLTDCKMESPAAQWCPEFVFVMG